MAAPIWEELGLTREELNDLANPPEEKED